MAGKHIDPLRLDPDMTTPEQRFQAAFIEHYAQRTGEQPTAHEMGAAYLAIDVARTLFIVIDPFSDDQPEHPPYPHIH